MRPFTTAGIALLTAVIALTAATDCRRRNPDDVQSRIEEPYPAKISEWKIFSGSPSDLKPGGRAMVYEVNNDNFKNYAEVKRFLWLPEGSSMTYAETGIIDLPIESILAQTYYYTSADPEEKIRLMETRLLIHTEEGWVGLPYIWNMENTEATLLVTKVDVDAKTTTQFGKEIEFMYDIPNKNECLGCHQNGGVTAPLGLKASMLNRNGADGENQLDSWKKKGILTGNFSGASAPRMAVWHDAGTGNIEQRARAYLDVNCSHCHNARGAAGYTGLSLEESATESVKFGVCKIPFSAGRGTGNLPFDIVPGRPEQSIMVFRLNSSIPGIMMPQFGRTVVHEEAVDLVIQWIRMQRGNCRPAR